MCQLPTIDTNTTPYHQRCRSADNQLDGSSTLVCTSVHGFLIEFQISINLTTEQFSIYPQTILDELWSREDKTLLDRVHIWFLLCIMQL